MDPTYEAEEVREFARAFKTGSIYLGTKPVYWNWTLQTSLADAEVEYHQHKSPAIYVKFDVKDVATLKRLGNPRQPTAFCYLDHNTLDASCEFGNLLGCRF